MRAHGDGDNSTQQLRDVKDRAVLTHGLQFQIIFSFLQLVQIHFTVRSPVALIPSIHCSPSHPIMATCSPLGFYLKIHLVSKGV